MKITHINEYVTAVPHIPSIEKSRPGDYRERPISIIEVHTDEGIVGIGEGGRGQSFSEAEKEWVGVEPLSLNLTTMGGAIGMAMFVQMWYWFPLIHFISLPLMPTALIGLTEKLKMPKNFVVRSEARPSLFASA